MNYCVNCEHRLRGDYSCYDACGANEKSRDPVSGRGFL